ALAHADRLDVRDGREDPDDHVAERPQGREVRFPEAHEIDARGPESMKDVDCILDSGPRESVQGPEDRYVEPSLMRVQEQGLQLRLAVLPAHVFIDIFSDNLQSLPRRLLASRRILF